MGQRNAIIGRFINKKMNLNKVMLIGRIANDIELKYTQNSVKKFVRVVVATNRQWKSKEGDRQEETSFHNVQFWDERADVIARFFNKGDEIFIEGRIQYSKYIKTDGSKGSSFQIIGEKFEFGRKADKSIKEIKKSNSEIEEEVDNYLDGLTE